MPQNTKSIKPSNLGLDLSWVYAIAMHSKRVYTNLAAAGSFHIQSLLLCCWSERAGLFGELEGLPGGFPLRGFLGAVALFGVCTVFFSGEYTVGLNCAGTSLSREMRMLAFGVGGSVLLMADLVMGLIVGEVALVLRGLGRYGDRGGAGIGFVFTCNDEGGGGRGALFALYVVAGRGYVEESCDELGACDIRNPICTVAEEAIDESLLWPPRPNTAGGGVNSLMSYMEVGSCCRELGAIALTGLPGSCGNREYEGFRA